MLQTLSEKESFRHPSGLGRARPPFLGASWGREWSLEIQAVPSIWRSRRGLRDLSSSDSIKDA